MDLDITLKINSAILLIVNLNNQANKLVWITPLQKKYKDYLNIYIKKDNSYNSKDCKSFLEKILLNIVSKTEFSKYKNFINNKLGNQIVQNQTLFVIFLHLK